MSSPLVSACRTAVSWQEVFRPINGTTTAAARYVGADNMSTARFW